MHTVDPNGLSETITNPERLKEMALRNFFDPQPYRKVLRVFAKNREGSTKSIVTAYYDNGRIRQYLECRNGRAAGLYLEWHPDGQRKLQSTVLAGQADLSDTAFNTWSFDGMCMAWNESGTCIALMPYKDGALQGEAKTFFQDGAIERITHYDHGSKEGDETSYYGNGQKFEVAMYHNNLRNGPSSVFFQDGRYAAEEEYQNDLLLNGKYFSPTGDLLSSVQNKEGLRSSFKDGKLASQQEVRNGHPEGWVTIFSPNGDIEQRYEIKNGKKNGREIRYFPHSSPLVPRICIEWRDDIIHGTVSTWYPNGALESQREMRNNVKQGLSMAWYSDKSIMLVEEYENDILVRGRYHKKGDVAPVSQVEKGTGTATIFDDSGAVVAKISYLEGKPQLD
jgi:antitoxin component YwqK of YwqJK toxin-antitoxin module